MDFGNYTDIKKVLSSYLDGSYTDAINGAFPIVRRVFSKTIGSELLSVPSDDAYEGLVSYKIAVILKDFGYNWVSKFYYEEDGYEYYLRYGLYSNDEKHDENYVGVYNKIACPYFTDVLKWLDCNNNYANYANIILSVKNYLYEFNGHNSPMGAPKGQLFYMDAMV